MKPAIFTAPRELTWTFPISRTHCGVPLGNGNFGVLVWGEDSLHLTVNTAEFWDHRNGEEVPPWASYEGAIQASKHEDFDNELIYVFNRRDRLPPQYKSSRLPFGRFELIPEPGVRLYQACLNLETGVLRVELKEKRGRSRFVTIMMAMGEDVLVVDDPTQVLVDVRVRRAWEWERAREILTHRELEESTTFSDDSGKGLIQSLPADPAMLGLCKELPGGCALCLARGESKAAALSVAEVAIHATLQGGINGLREEVENWWSSYWVAVPSVQVPEPFYQNFLDFALYKFACATSPSSTMPSGLQGPWAEEYQGTPWNGDYHFNVNIQQIYTLAVHANHPEHLLPLFDMMESAPFFSLMRQTAKRLYGVDDGLALTHAVDDRGRQVGGLGVGAVLDQACGGWAAQLYWLYYQYTGDVDFLRERAYPMLSGFLRAYEGMLSREGNTYTMPISISAEYRFYDDDGNMINWGANPSYQFACIHMLLDALLEAGKILDMETPERWLHLKKHLPPFTLVEGPDGPRIAIWQDQDLDQCHRHHSHLGAVYPFDSLGTLTPEMQHILDNSVDHWVAKGMGEWSEWCIPWAAILQARLGFTEAPRTLLNMWKEVYINEGWATVYLPRFRGITAHRRSDMVKPKETHEVIQLDGTMAGATAIYEMLVHRRHGSVHIFPAASEHWQDIEFSNIRVPGPHSISATRKDGQTTHVKVTALADGDLRLVIADRQTMVLCQGEKEIPMQIPCTLKLRKGDSIELRSPQEIQTMAEPTVLQTVSS